MRLLWAILVLQLVVLFGQNPVRSESDKKKLQNQFRMAIQLERRGQLEQAGMIYRYLSEHDPANYQYYRNYVNLLFRTKEYDRLETVVRNFVASNPQRKESRIDLGKVYFVQGDTSRAFGQWTAVLEEYSHSVNIYRHLFQAMIALRLYDAAEEYALQAREYHGQEYLFCVELAGLHALRRKYADSAREYLRFARQNPQNYRMASQQIMRFPIEEELFATVDSVLYGESQRFPEVPDLPKIRSDWLFKFGRYQAAFTAILTVEELSGSEGAFALDFAKDLIAEEEYALAEEVYSELLQKSQFQGITPQLLLGLAETLEKSALGRQQISPWFFFYQRNSFFRLNYVYPGARSDLNLQPAFAIYDSMITRMPRTGYLDQALYRLGKLRFRVSLDFDGAQKLYREALDISRNRQLRSECLLQLADLYIAKGDLEKTIRLCRTEAEKALGNPYEYLFRAQEMFAHLLSGEIEVADTLMREILGGLGPAHDLFNDVFGLQNFIQSYAGQPDSEDRAAFREYLRGEFLLRQNKLSEADELYRFSILNYPDAKAIEPVLFRGLQLAIHFRQKSQAEKLLARLQERESLLAAEALYMLGVTARQIAGWEADAQRYLETLLLEYPASFYAENARKQLRTFHLENGSAAQKMDD